MNARDARDKQSAAELLARAEAAFVQDGARVPQDPATLTPEATARMLHELQVHQIELELQNEELRAAEAAAEASRARYFDLYDLAPVGYCTVGESGLILEANLTLAALLGVARGALVKKPFTRFIAREDQNAFYLLRQRLLPTLAASAEQAGEPQPLELRLVKSDGSPFWAHLVATVAQDESGAPVIRFTLGDITARKQAESYREMGRDLLLILNGPEDLQASIQHVITTIKTQTGCDAVGIRLQDGDDFPYFAQDGFSPEFLKTENALTRRDSEGGLCRDQDGRICLECTCGLVISGQTPPGALQLLTPGGSVWTSDSITILDIPPAVDPRSHPRNVCVLQGYASVALVPIRDQDRNVGLIQINHRAKDKFTLEVIEALEQTASHIGEALLRKQAEKALRASEERHRAILETALDGFWLVDIQGRLREVNQAYCRMSGYSAQELLGMSIPDLEAQETSEQTADHIRRVMEHGEDRFEARHRRKDGSVFDVEVSVQYRPDHGGQLVVFLRDITERKRAEEEQATLEAQLLQAQKMEAVGQLAGGIAHDFNNILAAIIMQLDMLQLQPSVAPAELSEAVNEMLESANRAAKLTRQLLLFSRRQAMSPGSYDANGLLRGMTTLIRRLIGERVTVVLELSGEPLWFEGDAGMIEQVVTNLCINAGDAMPNGGQLTIAIRPVVLNGETARRCSAGRPGRFVCLEFKDAGSGIEPSVREHIFEPFFTTKEQGKGTGLGLATVDGIVAEHKGFVEVTSQVGRGSTFGVYLPSISAPSASEQPRASPGLGVGGSESILVVEDETAVRRIVVRRPRQLGYRVAEAENGVEALNVWEQEGGRFDLLFTDMVMPEGLSGLDLCSRLREKKPALKTIIASGYSASIVGDENLAMHRFTFLSKPYDIATLAATVRECLETGR